MTALLDDCYGSWPGGCYCAGLVDAAAVVDLVVITATAGLAVAVIAIGLRLFWMSLNCLKSAMRKIKQSS